MISADSFLEKLRKLFEERGFLSYENSSKDKSSEDASVLHEGVRQVLGLKTEDSVYMYWEWKELSLALNAMWLVLDQAASQLAGRQTTAIAHLFEESVQQEVAVSLLETARNNSQPIEFPSVTRRPTKSESSVRFVGKITAALLSTLGVIEESRKSGYGDLFSSLTDQVRTNEELLAHLDSMCASIDSTLSFSPPKSIVILRALGKAFEELNKQRAKDDLAEFSLSEFFIETEESANWAGLSDSVVLKRFLAISPEDAEAAEKAIAKFLAE